MKYLGIDWATKEHVVALVADDGSHLDTWKVAHDWSAVTALLERLQAEGGPGGARIALEHGAHALRAALQSAGYTVYEVNPMRSDRFRDRFRPAGSKDDRLDALVLAHALRTDEQWMRIAPEVSDLDQELFIRCRDRRTIVDHRRRCLQQLRQVLQASHPAMLQLLPTLGSRLAIALLRAYPDAESARRSRRVRVERILRECRARRLDADTVLAVLHEDGFPISDGEARAYADRVRWLVDSIEHFNRALADADAAIEELFEQHAAHDILLSVPGVGSHNAPHIAAEIASSVGLDAGAVAIQALAGTAPVTRKSGKQRRGHIFMRRACRRQLQAALFTVARCSLRRSRWARAYYDQLRERGAHTNVALRALSNKWAKIIATLLRTGQTYDEDRHLNDLRRAGVPWAPALDADDEKAA